MKKDLLFTFEFGKEVTIKKSEKKGIITRRLFSLVDYGDSQMYIDLTM